MYVRLAFAVAAHLDPEILLVDEVLAVGDAAFQKKCLGKIGDVAKGGRTVLFVSHNMGAVRSLCQKAALFEQGQLLGFGTTDMIVEQYNKSCNLLSLHTGQFIGKRTAKNCTGRVLIEEATIIPPEKWRNPLIITFHYEVKEPVEKFAVEWFLKDINGTRILSGLSPFVEQQWFSPQNGTTGEIRCIMKEWRLPGGVYSLSARLNIPFIELFDYVEDLAAFYVPDIHPGKPGFTFSADYGYFLPEISWEADKHTKIFNY
jgi:lipopolysaccharide transport system ATP-binding protein